jgi:hypothetical protein
LLLSGKEEDPGVAGWQGDLDGVVDNAIDFRGFLYVDKGPYQGVHEFMVVQVFLAKKIQLVPEQFQNELPILVTLSG